MSQPSSPQWYFARNNQQQGPVTREQLEVMVRGGQVTAGDLVWCVGMAQWEPAGNIFAGAIAPMAVPGAIPGGVGPAGTISYYNPMLTGGMQYVGFWWRFLATLIDWILIAIVNQIVNLIIYLPLGLTWEGESSQPQAPGTGPPAVVLVAMLVTFVLNSAVSWLYEALMTSSKHRATLGKMAIGVEVVRANGETLSFARATGRHFAKWLSGFLLCVGYLMAAFTQKKQGLHDFMCDTVVARKRTF